MKRLSKQKDLEIISVMKKTARYFLFLLCCCFNNKFKRMRKYFDNTQNIFDNGTNFKEYFFLNSFNNTKPLNHSGNSSYKLLCKAFHLAYESKIAPIVP